MATPTWTGEEWSATVAMPAWRTLLDHHAVDAVPIVFLADDASEKTPPSREQLDALLKLGEAQADLLGNLLSSLRGYYDRVRPKYVRFAAENPTFMGDPANSMPAEPDTQTLCRLHRLSSVLVHWVFARGLAYVGFSFSATWEPEHGVGVLTHDRRVVEVGGADVSFLEWVAEADRDRIQRDPDEAG